MSLMFRSWMHDVIGVIGWIWSCLLTFTQVRRSIINVLRSPEHSPNFDLVLVVLTKTCSTQEILILLCKVKSKEEITSVFQPAFHLFNATVTATGTHATILSSLFLQKLKFISSDQIQILHLILLSL